MNGVDLELRLADLVAGFEARPDTGPVRLHLDTPGWRWSFGADHPYFVASVTKLVTAALIMQLADSRELTLDQPAVELLPVGAMTGLHVRRGADRSEQITVRHLLAHTSGLPDYFEDTRADGGTTIARAFDHDTAWSMQDLLAITRGMRPRFAPGAAGKAHYSDTNYQLLGAIIEHLTGAPYAAAVHERVTVPLALTSTYVFGPDTLTRYDDIDPMLNGQVRLRIPHAMASFQADGGLVSTAAESARFLRAFFAGELFDPTHLTHMQSTWRWIFYPLRYGEGLMLFVLPRVLTGFRVVPRLVGHSGASGSVLFRAADVDLVISGTVNQVAKRATAFQLMTRAVLEVSKSA